MSYADRLQAFNSAIGDTQQHIENMKRTLTNGELEKNPVKGGLEIAGQVTGTGTALLGLKRGLEEKGAIRKMAGAIHKAIKGKQTTGSSTADSDGSGTTGDSSGTGTGTGDASAGGADGAGSGTASGTASGAPDPVNPSASSVGDAPTGAVQPTTTASSATDGATGDAGASGGASATDAPVGASDENPFSLESFMKQIQEKGSGTVTSEGAGVDSADLPSGGAGAGGATDTATLAGAGEDVGDASSAATQTATGQASIAERAQQLQLQLGQQTTQDSTGTVQGLTTSGTANTPAGQAHSLSQAQQTDADTARGQTDNPSANAENPDATISQGADQQASTGGRLANTAPAEEDGLSNGIKSALGVEEGIDEIAPEAGPFGWLLEGFSLLATLGTTIAGAVEPSEKKKPGATAPQMTGLSVGANLSQDAKNSVGAF